MGATSERRWEDGYAQAHESLVRASALIAPVLAEAQAGLVVVLDVVGMGNVNSRHSVKTGDRLLRALEDSLRSGLWGSGQVARLAGDQFLVLVPGFVSYESAVGSILRGVARVRVRGRWGRSVRVAVALGAATWHDEASRRTAISAAGEALSNSAPVIDQRLAKIGTGGGMGNEGQRGQHQPGGLLDTATTTMVAFIAAFARDPARRADARTTLTILFRRRPVGRRPDEPHQGAAR